MKIKSVLASIAACAIAVSAMAVTASAKVLNPASGDDKYCLDVVVPDGKSFGDIYGFEVKYTGTPAEGQSNVGAVCWQSTSVKWTQKEFSITAGEKDIDVKDNTITYTQSEPLFAAADEFAQIFVAQWSWDGANQMDFTVDSVKLLDKDGKVLGAAGGSSQADDSSSKADDSSSKADDSSSKADDSSSKADDSSSKADDGKKNTQTTGTKTGDAGVGIAVAGLALAGAAAFAARRKH